MSIHFVPSTFLLKSLDAHTNSVFVVCFTCVGDPSDWTQASPHLLPPLFLADHCRQYIYSTVIIITNILKLPSILSINDQYCRKVICYLWPPLIGPAAPWFLLFLLWEEVRCADLQSKRESECANPS